MDLTCIFFGLVFLISGYLFAEGKLLPFIKAWQAMPKEEKDRINIIPLCRNVGEIIALSGIIFLLNGMWEGFRTHWFAASMIAWLIVAGIDVMHIGKSKKYYTDLCTQCAAGSSMVPKKVKSRKTAFPKGNKQHS